jgi:uncharacterized protein (TIGR02270 family)
VDEDSVIRWDLAEEHLDEAAFLSAQWEAALRSPDFTLEEIAAGPEERLLAHLDALVLGGARVAKRLLLPALEAEDPGAVFAASFALAEGGRPGELEAVLAMLARAGQSQRAAIRRALAVAPRQDLAQKLARLATSARMAAELLEVLGALRVDPGLRLEPLARDPATEALALRLARVFPTRLDPAAIDRGLASSVPEVRAAALETGIIVGAPAAWPACEEELQELGPAFDEAALLAGLSGEERCLQPLVAALGDAQLARDAAFALGFSGRVAAAEALLEAMRAEALAPVAAEGFAAIAGLEVRKPFARPPLRWTPGAPDEPEGPDAELAKPDRDAIARWWQAHKLDRAQRWLRGRPWSAEAVLRELEQGPARRRAALALDLAVRTRGQQQLSWDALSARQRAELAAFRAAPRSVASYASRSAGGAPATPARVAPAVHAAPAPAPASSLAVTALGLVTALGSGLVQSCAASRARVLRLALLDELQLFDKDVHEAVPVRGHAATEVAGRLSGVARLVQLGAAGLADLVPRTGLTDLRRVALHLSLPSGLYLSAWEAELRKEREPEPDDEEAEEPRSAKVRRTLEAKLLPLLLRTAKLSLGPSRLFLHDGGGFVRALREAAQALASGAVDACIVGGIDSLVDRHVLEALAGLHLLATPEHAAGILPGEGAAFVLVERASAARRRGAAIQAVLGGCAEAQGQGRLQDVHEPGRALADAIAASVASAHAAPGLVIGSLNGDERRALDWGHAQVRLRLRGALRDAREWHPATSFGDLGAASGPAAVCAAARAFARGYSPSPECLVWLAGDDGSRAAFTITAAA